MRIIARLNVGGPARHIAQLAQLNPTAYDTLLVAGTPGPDEDSMADLFADAPGRLIVLPSLGRRIALLADLHSGWQILHLMGQFKPHIVETHTAKAGMLGRVAAFLLRVPVILHTFHGHVFYGYFNAFISKLVIWAERLLAAISSGLIAVSEQVRADLLKFNIAPADKVVSIPLGLALNEFTEPRPAARAEICAEFGLPPAAPIIMNIGRLVPVKNQALFVAFAAAWTKAGLPGSFLIVGDGSLRADLAAQIAAHGLSQRVYITGWRRDLPNLLAAADVLVNTSVNEGTPVAAIEAMAAGVPVVATAVGGVPDIVRPGETGWLTPSGDSAALVQAVQQALNCPAEQIETARAFALAQFDSQRLLRDMDLYYRAQLAHSRLGRK